MPDERLIRLAEQAVRALYPNAYKVVGRWYAGDPYVEVWTDRNRGGIVSGADLHDLGVL